MPWTQSFDALEARVEALRRCAAMTLFDNDVDGLAIVPSAAYGIATAARNLPLNRGDAVLVLEDQFPSNLLAWQQRCSDVGASIVVARRDGCMEWTDAVLAALAQHPRVRVVAIAQAHWHDGAVLDLARIAARTRAICAALVLDLSQSLGAMPVDLAAWQPDFIVAVGYKWLLGTRGLAWLWAAPRWRDEGTAIEQHWSAREDSQVWRFDATHAPRHRAGARRFDAGGVVDGERIAMAEAAFAQLRAWSVPGIVHHLAERMAALDASLDAHGLDTWRTFRHAPHFTALRPPSALLDSVAAAFRREGIVCTRRAGVLRLAPHLHVAVEAMRHVAAVAARVARG